MNRRLWLLMTAVLMTACASLPPGPVVPPPTPVPLHGGIVGPFYGPLDASTMAAIATSPDITLRAPVTTAAQAQAILASIAPHPTVKVLWLIEDVNGDLLADLVPVISGTPATWGVELGNELDLAGVSPKAFGAWVTTSYSALRANGYEGRVVSGGIYTTQRDALRYLTDAGIATWPTEIIAGVHRYGDPDSGVSGYVSRDAETQEILRVTAGHRVAVTEFGYVSRTPAEEAWVKDAVLRDFEWFKKLGAPLATIYQIGDGSGTSNLDHYGVIAWGGRFKPVAEDFGIAPRPPPIETLSFDLVACRSPFVDNYCDGPTGATFAIEVAANVWKTFQGDGNGYVFATGVPNVPDSHLIIQAPGYVDLSVHISPPTLAATNAKGIHNAWELTPAHVDPSTFSLQQLAAIRGAMWPQTTGACGNLSIGPRPGQSTNIFATVFLSQYTKSEADCMLKELHQVRGYTHAVAGPLVDSDGYHGIWQAKNWAANFDAFLDMLQTMWDAGLAPIVFIKPDGWSFEQTRDSFTALLQQPRAQKLIRLTVPMGWEAGAAYEYSSCTWAAAAQWVRQILPTALVFIHMPADRDAPAGTDARCNDDDQTWNPGGNAAAWGRVTPFIHGWLVQNGAFECPTCIGPNGQTNFQNFQDQFNPAIRGSYMDRFGNGYAGWPRSSAWGDGVRIRVMAGEFRSYWTFWQGRLESEGVAWGDAAMAAGSDAYLDGGTVSVTERTP